MEFDRVLIRARFGFRPDRFPKVCQELGIDRIGLGQPSEIPSKAAHLSRMDDGHGEARLFQAQSHRLLITSCGFSDNQ